MSALFLILHHESATSGTTLEWCQSRNVDVRVLVPSLMTFDRGLDFRGAIVFGGDMETWETRKFPWLLREKTFIRRALAADKRVFGLCLGAQLMAEQLGATVTAMGAWELGWYPVNAIGSRDLVIPLHWHSSTFSLPPGCERAASNEICPNQGFRRSARQLGFQFHAEIDGIRLEHALKGWSSSFSGLVETPEQIRAQAKVHMHNLKSWYFHQLDEWWQS